MSLSKNNVRVHNYGLDLSRMLGGDRAGLDYEIRSDAPKVILVNVEKCRDKIDVYTLLPHLRGTSHFEFELYMAWVFVRAVVRALEKGEKEADVSKIFDRDLIADGNRRLTREEIWDLWCDEFLDVIEQSGKIIKVTLRA